MAEQQKSPVDAHAVELIQQLAVEGSAPAVVQVNTTGLGAGIPPEVPLVFDRKEQQFKSAKSLIEDFRVAPQRRKGIAIADTLQSFIHLTNRHKDDQSALFGRSIWPSPSLTAVLNYDAAGADARFGDHRIVYEFPLTEEFKAWVEFNAQPMDQETFAAFLEEHAAELAAPMDGERSEYERLFNETMATPMDVLLLSRHLEVNVNAKAKQGVRLQTGERVVEFSEEHVNAKGEAVQIPGIFMVSVPAFVDGEAVRIPARLRYRISGGSIKWFYQLYRWEFFLREQVQRDLSQASQETGLPAFEGKPEAR